MESNFDETKAFIYELTNQPVLNFKHNLILYFKAHKNSSFGINYKIYLKKLNSLL